MFEAAETSPPITNQPKSAHKLPTKTCTLNVPDSRPLAQTNPLGSNNATYLLVLSAASGGGAAAGARSGAAAGGCSGCGPHGRTAARPLPHPGRARRPHPRARAAAGGARRPRLRSRRQETPGRRARRLGPGSASSVGCGWGAWACRGSISGGWLEDAIWATRRRQRRRMRRTTLSACVCPSSRIQRPWGRAWTCPCGGLAVGFGCESARRGVRW